MDQPWHGTLSGYSYHRCRCRTCKDAINRYHAARRARYPHVKAAQAACDRRWREKRRAALGSPPPRLPREPKPTPHGTVNGYEHYRCRCAACRAAHAARQRRYQAGRAWSPPRRPVPHGTHNGYSHYRCRCEACHMAERAYRRQLPRS